jgi:hypothetical protein
MIEAWRCECQDEECEPCFLNEKCHQAITHRAAGHYDVRLLCQACAWALRDRESGDWEVDDYQPDSEVKRYQTSEDAER